MSALDDAASLDMWAHGELQRMKEELTRLRAENNELKDMLNRVRRAIEEIDDADCYVALQAALRGEPSK